MKRSLFDPTAGPTAESIFQRKKDHLYAELAKIQADGELNRPPNDGPIVRIKVRRDCVLEDTYLLLRKIDDEEILAPLYVAFRGEVGVDGGGVTRDWYSTLSRRIFNPDYGLIIRSSAADDYRFQLNPNSGIHPEHLEIFRFIGTIMGKALVDRCFLDAQFSRLVYKRILNNALTIDDMATVDPELHKSLLWLLENNLEGEDLGLTFSVDKEYFGTFEEIELKPDGNEVNVCEDNKLEYVDLLCEWHLEKSTESQFQALMAGIARFVEPTLLQEFDENELEWLFGGNPLDVEDWRRSTVYRSEGYGDSPMCQVITWFWELVESWSQEMRARLLRFATGTSQVPYPEGFEGLTGADGRFERFSIMLVSDTSRLPQAHTCFNELLLPHYDSKEVLESKLKTAISECGNQFHLK